MIMESTTESWRQLKKRELIKKDMDNKGNINNAIKFNKFNIFFFILIIIIFIDRKSVV